MSTFSSCSCFFFSVYHFLYFSSSVYHVFSFPLLFIKFFTFPLLFIVGFCFFFTFSLPFITFFIFPLQFIIFFTIPRLFIMFFTFLPLLIMTFAFPILFIMFSAFIVFFYFSFSVYQMRLDTRNLRILQPFSQADKNIWAGRTDFGQTPGLKYPAVNTENCYLKEGADGGGVGIEMAAVGRGRCWEESPMNGISSRRDWRKQVRKSIWPNNEN